MLLGYNTNGLAHHDLFDAVALLAEIGYRSVAVTIDHGALSPLAETRQADIRRLGELLNTLGIRSVIETGARFLLDPRQKHEPTLLSPDPAGRARRLAFYKYAVDVAAELGSDCVSLWSGILHDAAPRTEAIDRLVTGLTDVLEFAAAKDVVIGFEPEPGMLIDSMDAFDQLHERIGADNLRLTLDVGHLHCQGETPIADVVKRYAARIVNVHIEDMRHGVHEHLMFGEGEIDFPPIIRALAEVGYSGGLHVELSRHSHQAPQAARRAFEFLRPMIDCHARNE